MKKWRQLINYSENGFWRKYETLIWWFAPDLTIIFTVLLYVLFILLPLPWWAVIFGPILITSLILLIIVRLSSYFGWGW